MKRIFKFLDPYTKEDKDIFFGRDNEIQEVYYKLHESRLLLLYGASGTGKTSILQCGVANLFEETDWFPLSIRRKDDIVKSLAGEIQKHLNVEVKDLTKITNYLNSLYLNYYKPIYLIFDQFEELFISGSKAEQKEFLKVLQQILNANFDIKVIISIREEYLAYITNFENEIPTIFDNKVRIEKMTSNKAEEVIGKTCNAYGIGLEDEEKTPQKILALLGKQKFGIELTYLQVLLDKLHRTAHKINPDNIVFDNNVIEHIGTVEDVLSDFLEEQIQLTDNPKLSWKILKTFVSSEGTKFTLTIQNIKTTLNEWGIDISNKEIEEYLNKFAELKIVRLLKEEDTNIYELTHDSLAKKIFESMTSEEKHLLEVRSFLLASYKNYSINKSLLNKKDVAYIEPYFDQLTLDKDIKNFYIKSKKAIKRKFIILSSTVILIVLILSALTAYSFQQKRLAEKKQKELEKNQIELERKKRESDERLRQFIEAEESRIKTEVNSLIQKANSYYSTDEKFLAIETLKKALELDSTNTEIKEKLKYYENN